MYYSKTVELTSPKYVSLVDLRLEWMTGGGREGHWREFMSESRVSSLRNIWFIRLLFIIFIFSIFYHELPLGSCGSVVYVISPLDSSLHMEVSAVMQKLGSSVSSETMSSELWFSPL